MRGFFRKPAGRFAILYVALFAVCSLFAWLNLQIVSQEEVFKRYGAQIDSELDAIVQLHVLGGIDAVREHLENRLRTREGGAEEAARYYRLVDEKGDKLLGSIPDWAEENVAYRYRDYVLLDDLPRPESDEFLSDEYFNWRLDPDYDLLIKELTLMSGYVVTVGQDLNFIQDTRAASYVLIFMICVLFLGGGLMGWRMIASAFERIDRILGVCSEIIRTGKVSHRVEDPQDGRDPEKLIPTLNEMLERIETSFQSLQLSAANIAHDLKTPLARLRAKVESFETEGVYREETIGEVLQEIERMQCIFDASMQIALLESGKPIENRKSVALDVLVRGLMEFYEPVFEEKELELESRLEPVKVEGDEQLLGQMLSNLLENAVKYVPKGGKVSVETIVEGGIRWVRIRDTGLGIAGENQAKAFDKFFRGEASRTSEGNGLGLSMVKAIAEAHGGTVALKDNQPGLLVEIRF